LHAMLLSGLNQASAPIGPPANPSIEKSGAVCRIPYSGTKKARESAGLALEGVANCQQRMLRCSSELELE